MRKYVAWHTMPLRLDPAVTRSAGELMQTLQYTRSLKRIVKELKVNELIGYLEPILTPNSNIPLDQSKKDHFAELLFASRSGFDRLMADPPTQRVLTSLEVGS